MVQLILQKKRKESCRKGFSALSLPLQIRFLKKHSKIDDKVMAERPSIVKAATKQQQAVPHLWWRRAGGLRQQRQVLSRDLKSRPWILLPGRSVVGISDCLLRSSRKMRQTGIHHPDWDESLSSDRLIWSLVLWTVCVFHWEKNNFPVKDFFLQIFPMFQIFFRHCIPSFQQRGTERGLSLCDIHLLKVLSIFWKIGCSWGTVFPVCSFNVAFLLYLQIWNLLIFNMICIETAA